MMFRIFNNIRPASKLTSGSNYHLFKENIEPKWEHAENVKGGKWIVTIKGQKDQLDKMWLWAVLACIGENFDDGSEICGMVVSLRKPLDRLALWTKSALNEPAQRSIGYL
jgi:translation initiation factor 4E